MKHLGVRLDTPLPKVLHVGRGTAILLRGSFDVCADAGDIRLSLNGIERRPAVIARAGDRANFWEIVEIPPAGAPAGLSIDLTARLVGRTEVWEPLAELSLIGGAAPTPEVTPPLPGSPPLADEPWIAICLATYEPQLDLLRAQIDSLRAQRYQRWFGIISDDGSSDSQLAAIRAIVADDRRFHLVSDGGHRGHYRNFEQALAAVPGWARYVALCDQDDIWHADKLGRLLAALGNRRNGLVCCDARIVDRDQRVLSDTFWTTRRRGGADPRSLMAANWVSGAMTMFGAELTEIALPFPIGPAGLLFHDQWIACVASLTGSVRAVDEALVDYVQHSRNAFGHARAVDEAISHLRIRNTWRSMRAGDGRHRWNPSHIDSLMRAELIAATLRLRLGAASPVDQTAASQRVRGGKWATIAARQWRHALLQRMRNGPSGAEAALAWGAMAAMETAWTTHRRRQG